jgi:Ca2+-transporting ATPase
MGKRGTQVAKEAADMVLKDDAFSTIIAAIGQGRTILANIRRFIVYLLSGNVGEVLIVALALLTGSALPILPLQILYLNMLSDVFPALALGVGPGDPEAMKRPPRPRGEPIITRDRWISIGAYGILIAIAVLASFMLAQKLFGMSAQEAVAISFPTLTIARLLHVFNMRSPRSHVLVNTVTANLWVWAALILCTALLMAAIYVEPLANVLHLKAPDTSQWALIIGMSFFVLLAGQIALAVYAKFASDNK